MVTQTNIPYWLKQLIKATDERSVSDAIRYLTPEIKKMQKADLRKIVGMPITYADANDSYYEKLPAFKRACLRELSEVNEITEKNYDRISQLLQSGKYEIEQIGTIIGDETVPIQIRINAVEILKEVLRQKNYENDILYLNEKLLLAQMNTLQNQQLDEYKIECGKDLLDYYLKNRIADEYGIASFYFQIAQLAENNNIHKDIQALAIEQIKREIGIDESADEVTNLEKIAHAEKKLEKLLFRRVILNFDSRYDSFCSLRAMEEKCKGEELHRLRIFNIIREPLMNKLEIRINGLQWEEVKKLQDELCSRRINIAKHSLQAKMNKIVLEGAENAKKDGTYPKGLVFFGEEWREFYEKHRDFSAFYHYLAVHGDNDHPFSKVMRNKADSWFNDALRIALETGQNIEEVLGAPYVPIEKSLDNRIKIAVERKDALKLANLYNERDEKVVPARFKPRILKELNSLGEIEINFKTPRGPPPLPTQNGKRHV